MSKVERETTREQRRKPRQIRLVSGTDLQPATLDRLDKRTGAARWIHERRRALLQALPHIPPTPVEAGAVTQIAYLEYRLSIMQASELLEARDNLAAITRAQRELRGWYSFLGLRALDYPPRNLEDLIDGEDA